ncbi:MAG: hypothetical protein A2Z46_09535 [Nitrospirae bacterium RBG_19FT_COMBO_55_12]|nr:MAG: hypothetical protein A2Z46_09535 [Nitrospirae bacterium RBG_19FT_COMBO_55_12]
MSERTFRLILGGTLLLLLFWERLDVLYVYIGIVAFEGLTNLRIPVLISRLRYGRAYLDPAECVVGTHKYDFDAERVLRLVIVVFLVVSLFVFPKSLWFFPWFVGFALFMAGITGICPMAMLIKKLGFK